MAITKKVITATLVRSGYYYNEFPIEVTLTYTNSNVTKITATLKNPDPTRTSNFWATSNYWVGIQTTNKSTGDKPIYGSSDLWFSTFGANGNVTVSKTIPATNQEKGDEPIIVVNTNDGVTATPGTVRYTSVKVYEDSSSTPSSSAYDGYKNSIVKILP